MEARAHIETGAPRAPRGPRLAELGALIAILVGGLVLGGWALQLRAITGVLAAAR